MTLRSELDLVKNWGLDIKPLELKECHPYVSDREVKPVPDLSPIFTLLKSATTIPENKKSRVSNDDKYIQPMQELLMLINDPSRRAGLKIRSEIGIFLERLVANEVSEKFIIDFLNNESVKKLFKSNIGSRLIRQFLRVQKLINKGEKLYEPNPHYLNVLRYLFIEDPHYSAIFDNDPKESLVYSVNCDSGHPFFNEIFTRKITNPTQLAKIAEICYPTGYPICNVEYAQRFFLGDHSQSMFLVDVPSHPMLLAIKDGLPCFSTDLANVVFRYAQGCDISFSYSLILQPPICLQEKTVLAYGKFQSPLANIHLPFVEEGRRKEFKLKNATKNLDSSKSLFKKDYSRPLPSHVVELGEEGAYVFLQFDECKDEDKMNEKINLFRDGLFLLHGCSEAIKIQLISAYTFTALIQKNADIVRIRNSPEHTYFILRTARGIQAGFELAFQLGLVHPELQAFIARYVAIVKTVSEHSEKTALLSCGMFKPEARQSASEEGFQKAVSSLCGGGR